MGFSDRDLVKQIQPLRWTITTPLYNIGEHAYNLSDEFKETHAGIPWAKISGLETFAPALLREAQSAKKCGA